jgi:hypothetical protein
MACTILKLEEPEQRSQAAAVAPRSVPCFLDPEFAGIELFGSGIACATKYRGSQQATRRRLLENSVHLGLEYRYYLLALRL